MKEINILFFELIQVALGIRQSLSHVPVADEWNDLYQLAKRQSLVGVCFAAVQHLKQQRQEMEPKLYIKWMGIAVQIKQRNDVVNRECTILGRRLKEKGFNCSILKGQGVAQFYAEQLRSLRQCGDIDALLWKDGLNLEETRDAVIQFARSISKDAVGSEHHVSVHVFRYAEVELHYEPSYFCNPLANRRFRRWCVEHRADMMWCDTLGCFIPNTEYNRVFLLSHIFRHYVSEGVGLRQLMDYYFVLIGTKSFDGADTAMFQSVLKSFNMLNFAGAVMYVMREVFGMSEQNMVCKPNKRLGKKMLMHIMRGGNFGFHNTDTVVSRNSHIGRFFNRIVLDLSLAFDYPCEALWSPFSMVREFLRNKI